MSNTARNNNYGYYYSQSTTGNYPEQQYWTAQQQQQQQQYNSGYQRTGVYDHTAHNAAYYAYQTPTAQQYNGHGRNVNPQPHRYTDYLHPPPPPPPPSNWNRGQAYKRPRQDSESTQETKSKATKKKKKPLSQNVPSKRDWSVTEAVKAFNCEREYNKRRKNQSLIIKFPDLELNKEIVSKYHTAIENVHFQQPSTARFCFVTLDESADPDVVISALNKIPFGPGYLAAEYKKDREEDQNIGPEDIDPYTLYVGNLAQEITKDDMLKLYPKTRRIDIGYAKKMKYTRYAFVTFKNIEDSIEAFKQTHSKQIHSKSLIVRFRRLHGTVGMPGESKPQNPPRNKDSPDLDDSVAIGNDHADIVSIRSNTETPDREIINENMYDDLDDSESIVSEEKVNIKREPYETAEYLAQRTRLLEDRSLPVPPDEIDERLRPIKMEIKEEPKDTQIDTPIEPNVTSIDPRIITKTPNPIESCDPRNFTDIRSLREQQTDTRSLLNARSAIESRNLTGAEILTNPPIPMMDLPPNPPMPTEPPEFEEKPKIEPTSQENNKIDVYIKPEPRDQSESSEDENDELNPDVNFQALYQNMVAHARKVEKWRSSDV